jgi:hypothetical protein
MIVRKSFTGALLAAVAGSALVFSAGPASAADADDTTFPVVSADVIGVGSDTSQHAVFLLANAFNATTPTPANRLATFAATGGGQITIPGGAIDRPNGSGAGKGLLFGAGNNANIDFARSSSSLSTGEINAGLQQFPFALDTLTMAVSNSVASHAPAALTPAQIVSIYKGDVSNWTEVGGTAGVIKPKIPQNGSGTRSFFVAQLTAMNGGTPVTLAASVAEVQEHDDTLIKSDPDAIAPFSVGRAGLLGTTLRLTTGWQADRALYNVVRGADLAKPEITALFGPTGFACSDPAADLIEAAGFKQLARAEDGGVCGAATQAATTNFTLNEPVAAVPTTTTVTVSSPSARSAKIVAKVAGSQTPQGKVTFYQGQTALTTANLVGGQATLTKSGLAPGKYTFGAVFTPAEDSPFVTSGAVKAGVVKTSSSISETFPTSVAKGAKAKGSITVALAGIAAKATGALKVKVGGKTITKTLAGGKVTLTLKLAKGKNTVTVTWGGDANGVGATKTFTVKQK